MEIPVDYFHLFLQGRNVNEFVIIYPFYSVGAQAKIP